MNIDQNEIKPEKDILNGTKNGVNGSPTAANNAAQDHNDSKRLKLFKNRRVVSLLRSKKRRTTPAILHFDGIVETKLSPWKVAFYEAGFQPLPYVISAKTLILKYFWTIAALLLTSCAIAHTYFIVNNAVSGNQWAKIEYPLLTDISIDAETRFQYPKFMICFNWGMGVNASKLVSSQLIDGNNDTLTEKAIMMLTSMYLLPSSGAQFPGAKIYQLYNHLFSHNLTEYYENFMTFTNKFRWKCTVFKNCTIGNLPIDCCEIFEPTFHLLKGWCYRNIPSKMTDRFFTGTLQINIDRIIRDLAYLIIGSNGFENGVSVLESYTYTLQQKSINQFSIEPELLSDDSGTENCVKSAEMQYFDNYTLETCMTERFYYNIPNITSNCSLLVWSLVSGGKSLSSDSLKPSCDRHQIDDWWIAYFNNQFFWDKIQTVCKPLCQRWLYNIQYINLEINNQSLANLATFDWNITSIAVRISFPERFYKHSCQSSPLGVIDYLAQIGGNLNLWLGCSLVSFIYLFVLGFDNIIEKVVR